MAIWTYTGRGNACRVTTECERVAAVRTTQPKPAVERLHSKAACDECPASQRHSKEKDDRPLKLELGADPIRAEENCCEQRDSNPKEDDKKRKAQPL